MAIAAVLTQLKHHQLQRLIWIKADESQTAYIIVSAIRRRHRTTA
jgi:hypothetical protein